MPEALESNSSRKRRGPSGPVAAIAIAIVLIGAGIFWYLWHSHTGRSDQQFTGYVVSQDIYMTSPVSGTLVSVEVQRGARINQGQPLFHVDPTVRASASEQARAQISANQALVAQQQSALARAQADLAAAQADADRSAAELRRLTAAHDERAGSVALLELEQAQATARAALDKRDAARGGVQSASAAIAAARAQQRQAEAGLVSAERELSDLAPVAPANGRIEDIMYKPGESVAANMPVVSIVPDGEVKVRFYVPESKVNAFKPGRRVAIACDGCPAGMSATVDFVAPRPEYTPPIIYSLDARQKLVFLVEALPSNPTALVPGQPMDVSADSSAP